MLNKAIFRKYDIRGIVGVDLTYQNAYQIGLALGVIFHRNNVQKISIGRDGRLSSQELEVNLINGLIESGIDIVKIGLVSTPCGYFSVHHLNLGGNVMITGSHNPKEYNGFKITIANQSFFGDDILEIWKICEAKDFVKSEKIGVITEIDIIDDYISEITSFIDKSKKINISFDAGNGSGGEIMTKIAKKLNISENNLLYCDIDGNFPNHHPDPTVEKNMQDLSSLVLKNQAVCGIGFDGDADRIGIVDNKGRFVYGDILVCILAKYLLQEAPNSTIIADVKASKVLFDKIAEYGGKAIMWKTGHSFIKDKMKKENAMMAGEMSGHIFYKHRYYGYDDGIYTAMRLIEILQKNDIILSDLIDSLPKTFVTPEINIKVSEDEKFQIVDKIIEIAKSRYKDYVDIDGIRVNLPNGWWLARASNTQNCIVVRAEGVSQNDLETIKSEIFGILEILGIQQQ